jgi:predicted transcriptional regulator
VSQTLDRILDGLPATISELTSELGLRRSTIREYVMALLAAGRVARVRVSKTFIYLLPGKHDPEAVEQRYRDKWMLG